MCDNNSKQAKGEQFAMILQLSELQSSITVPFCCSCIKSDYNSSCKDEGNLKEETLIEREQAWNEQMYDQIGLDTRLHELRSQDSYAVQVTKAENNQRKLAAILQRQQRRQTNQINFHTQQLRYPNHGRFAPQVNQFDLRNSFPAIDLTRNAIPTFLNPECNIARAAIESHEHSFNSHAFNSMLPQRDTIFSSQLQMNDQYSYAITDPVTSNISPMRLMRRNDKEGSRGPSFLPTDCEKHQLLLQKITSESNAITRSIHGQPFQYQTMRSPTTSDSLPSAGTLRTLDRVPLAIGCSNNSRNYFSDASSYEQATSGFRMYDNSLHPAEPSLPKYCNQLSETELQLSRGINNAFSQTVPMQSDTDVHHLSKYQCLIRQQLEFFAAKPENAMFSVQGRKKPIRIGQVGIQCRHCCHLPHRTRGRGAVYYPVNLAGVYQAVQNMATVHLNQHCSEISDEVRTELKLLRGKRDESTSTGGKYYWTSKCEDVGVVEEFDGIFFSKTK